MKKTVLITGASLGIGNATAKKFAENGHNVIAVSRNISLLNELKSEFESISVHQLDVSDFNEVKEFAINLKNVPIDIIVNNAGGGFDLPGDIINDKVESWRKSYDLNVIAPMELSRLLFTNMNLAKAPQVIIVTSTAGRFPYKGGSNYAVAKHAEVALAKLLRMEFANKNIRVTEIAPGSVNSRSQPGWSSCLEPKDVAEAIFWSSEVPEYVNVDSIQIMHINNTVR
jgi:NADP-dependent 3-hydroxy acid dehydrogenase YdfG